MSGHILRLLERVPRSAYGLAALLFVGSLLWGGRQPVAVGLFPPPYDLLAHLVTYAMLTALVWLALGGRWPWVVVFTVALAGFVDEWQQSFLPGRHANWSDGAMDVLSAVLVVGVLSVWSKRLERDRLNDCG